MLYIIALRRDGRTFCLSDLSSFSESGGELEMKSYLPQLETIHRNRLALEDSFGGTTCSYAEMAQQFDSSRKTV